jgi:hypothetical protein
MESQIGAESFKLLRIFSTLANKATGGAHPMDEARWHAFVISVFDSGRELDVLTLIEWLIDDGWSEAKAHEVGIRYESAMTLLRAYKHTH